MNTITKATFESKLMESRSCMMMGNFLEAEKILDSLFDVNGSGWDSFMELTNWMGNPNAVMSQFQYFDIAGAAYTDLSEAHYRNFHLSMNSNNISFASASLSNAARVNQKARDKVSAEHPDLAIRISYIQSKIAFAEGSLDEGMKQLRIIQTLSPVGERAKKIKTVAFQELQRIMSDQTKQKVKNTVSDIKHYSELAKDLVEISDWLAEVIRSL